MGVTVMEAEFSTQENFKTPFFIDLNVRSIQERDESLPMDMASSNPVPSSVTTQPQ